MKKYTYRTFVLNMILCAGILLTIIWGGEPPHDILPRLVATTFIIGFGSFLLWATEIAWDVRSTIVQQFT